jgi:hypothetical protein
MPRNVAKPLSAADRLRQNAVKVMLTDTVGDVTVTYVKRNGQRSSSTGPVAFFGGKPGYDTGSVTIRDHVKGERTINMHRVIGIDHA